MEESESEHAVKAEQTERAARSLRQGASSEGLVWGEDETDEPFQELSFSCPIDHNGSSVYVQGWARAQSLKAPVVFVHDLGEQGDLYAGAASILVRFGFNAYAFDLRGHGRSTELTGDVLSFQDLIKDLLQVVAWIRYKSNGRLPFLMGQGVGALLLMHFQKEFPQYGQRCILLAPILEEQTVMPFFSRVLISGMSQLFPGTRLPRFLLPYFLPVSEESKERGLNTSLVITARFAQELLQAIRSMNLAFTSLLQDNLIICPIEDSIYSSTKLHKLIASHPKPSCLELCEVPGIRSHALTGDKDELERLFQVLIPWMQHQSIAD